MRRRLAFVSGALVALTSSGYVVPAVVLNDGTDAYEGAERQAAKAAIDELEIGFSSPSAYRIWTTKFQVTSLSSTDNPACPYRAVVINRTYFGIRGKGSWDVFPGCGFSPRTQTS